MYKKTNFCPEPFQQIEIFEDGNVYVCCPSWNDYYSIGNVFTDSIENVWNSEKAINLRTKILNNDYSLCKKERCYILHNKNFHTDYEFEFNPIMNEYPAIVKLGYDYECNIACKICRNKIKRLSDEELKDLDDKINTFFLPLLKNAKLLVVNTHGDPFGSRHSRKLIKAASNTYKDLKFDFTTNGVLCNEKMFETLGITPEKIDTIRISIHAATKKTYGKIIQNGEELFDKLLENLEYLSRLKEKNNFTFIIQFVVMADNYKEMPQFVEMAKKYNAGPIFWEYKKDCCAYTSWESQQAIVEPEHKFHKKLIKTLHHKNMYLFPNSLYPMLLDLQNKEVNSILDKIKKIFIK